VSVASSMLGAASAAVMPARLAATSAASGRSACGLAGPPLAITSRRHRDVSAAHAATAAAGSPAAVASCCRRSSCSRSRTGSGQPPPRGGSTEAEPSAAGPAIRPTMPRAMPPSPRTRSSSRPPNSGFSGRGSPPASAWGSARRSANKPNRRPAGRGAGDSPPPTSSAAAWGGTSDAASAGTVSGSGSGGGLAVGAGTASTAVWGGGTAAARACRIRSTRARNDSVGTMPAARGGAGTGGASLLGVADGGMNSPASAAPVGAARSTRPVWPSPDVGRAWASMPAAIGAAAGPSASRCGGRGGRGCAGLDKIGLANAGAVPATSRPKYGSGTGSSSVGPCTAAVQIRPATNDATMHAAERLSHIPGSTPARASAPRAPGLCPAARPTPRPIHRHAASEKSIPSSGPVRPLNGMGGPGALGGRG